MATRSRQANQRRQAGGRSDQASNEPQQGNRPPQGKARQAAAPVDRRAAAVRAQQARSAAANASATATSPSAGTATERRQQTLIGVIVTLIFIALVAGITFFIYQQNHAQSNAAHADATQARQQLQQVKEKPATANDKGGFLFSREGYGKPIANAPTIEVYMDPLCPGCGNFSRTVEPTLRKLLDAGQINLAIYPMAFLDRASSDHYSNRVSGAIAYIASHDPDPNHLMGFIGNVYASDFQPLEGAADYKPVSDASIAEQAVKAGVPSDVAQSAVSKRYDAWLAAIDDYTPNRSELWNVEGQSKGSMTTPTVVINGHTVNMAEIARAQLPTVQALLRAIGLDEAQIGKAGVMPSIGAQGKPLSIAR